MNRMKFVSAIAIFATGQLMACTENRSEIPVAGDDSPRDTAIVSDVASCEKCAIAVLDSLILGTPNDSLVPIRNSRFARNSEGIHYLYTEGETHPVLVYDSGGKFIGRHAPTGGGPGEYEMVGRVAIGPADSVFVIEPAGIVIHAFDARGKYARKIQIDDGAWVSAVASRGPALFFGRGAASEDATSKKELVIRYRGNGQVLDTIVPFAPPSGTTMKLQLQTDDEQKGESEIQLPVSSEIYPAPDGSFWALADGNYRLEKYDSTATVQKLFGVRVKGEPLPWMTDADAKAARNSGQKIDPFGLVKSPRTKYFLECDRWVDIDANGLLWVTRQVPAPSWDTIPYKPIKTTSAFGPESMMPPDIEDRIYHSVVEVIDPTNGRLLVRRTFPFRAKPVRAGFIGRVASNPEGFLTPIVYRVQLTGR